MVNTLILILFFRRITYLKKSGFIVRKTVNVAYISFSIYLTWTDNIHLFVGENQIGIAPRLLHFILSFLYCY